MSWKPKDNIPAKQLIEKADDCLRRVEQWLKMDAHHLCYEYQCRAAQLIEMLEVLHCGSVGGKHCNFPSGKDSLKARLDHLKEVFK